MKTHLRNIFFILFGGLLFFVTLLYLNYTNDDNGFNREFLPVIAEFKHSIELPAANLNFVGMSDHNVILKDFRDPYLLYSVDLVEEKITVIPVALPKSFNLKSRYFNIDILDNSIFISNAFGEILTINRKQTSRTTINNFAFDQLIALSKNSIVVRSVNLRGNKFERFLNKIQLSKEGKIQNRLRLIPQIDGFFCNDGWLQYDDKQGKIIYTYFYRGSFVCLDTNLNLIYEGKTIDTVKFAKIKISVSETKLTNGKSRKAIRQATPPVLINKVAALDKSKIYILSGLKADNEKFTSFIKNQVVDVYSTIDGKYLYSFYIPNYRSMKPYEIQVRGRTITAIYSNYIVAFNLNYS